ncbi:virB8 family protein [Cypionkella psychrotolerans]|uniref:virB8 family protein n=1 Tax=Cypionkella psychrotolerans TaxID=1678131 RepID=UPI0006B447D6|nr:type IV secretion system protein [Cypionkella psychrotolerans]
MTDSMMDEFQADMVLGPRRRERFGYAIGGIGAIIGVCGMVAAASLFPLKTTETVIVVVDKSTGDIDRAVTMAPLQMGERDALIQAQLVAYVDDRETFDQTDSEHRVNAVLDRSKGDAERTLRALWSSTNPDYPPKIYSDGSKIDVTIKRINLISEAIAQVNFTRTLRQPRSKETVTRSYVATVGFTFQPQRERRLEMVWANPLGFSVQSYRVDAEVVEDAKK